MQNIAKKAGGVVYVTAKNNLTEFIPGHFSPMLRLSVLEEGRGIDGRIKEDGDTRDKSTVFLLAFSLNITYVFLTRKFPLIHM